MAKCTELKEWHADQSCMEIVKDIAAHEADYLPSKLHGISITRMGRELVRLSNTTAKGEKERSYRGSIEYIDVKKEMDAIAGDRTIKLLAQSSSRRCVIC